MIIKLPVYKEEGFYRFQTREVKMAKKKKAKPIFRVDCFYFSSSPKEKMVIVDQPIISYYRCLAYKGEEVVIISCGQDCPFYKKRGVR